MEIALITGLFMTGFLLLVIEFFFIPGNTVIGVIGILVLIFGIYQVYSIYDAQTGTVVTSGVLLLFLGFVYYAVKSRAWEGFSNKNTLTGKIRSMENEDEVRKGDEGIAVSAIRPIGKARINDKNYEVSSFGDFISTATPVRIVKVTQNKIYVEALDKKISGHNSSREKEADL